jgi:superfamily II DNA helicase RecQ
LGNKQYVGEIKPENRLFAQYHQQYSEKMKRFVVKEMCKENSRVRLMFATVALGMGLNAPYIRCVVHYKPPTSWKSTSGRQYEQDEMASQPLPSSTSMPPTSERHARPGIEQSIVKYCRTTGNCFRQVMLQHFGHNKTSAVDQDACCSHCDQQVNN